MEKLKLLPHKFLFYFGLFLSITFLGLAYWQFKSYQEDKITFEYFNNNNEAVTITLADLYLSNSDFVFEFNKVKIGDYMSLSPIKNWYLRSRVHNGESGYNLITLYKQKNEEQYLLVNNGWIPLDKNINNIFLNQEISFIGRLMDYDTQSFGQDDVPNSEFLFRLDKNFIQQETSVILPNFYLTLTEFCGDGVECINLIKPYDAPHLSYSFQWLFFAFCLLIVVFRKNKII